MPDPARPADPVRDAEKMVRGMTHAEKLAMLRQMKADSEAMTEHLLKLTAWFIAETGARYDGDA